MIITFVKKINDTEVVAGDSITLNFNVGMRGAQGVQGEGVPTGGEIGQVLAKKSSTDFDTEWVDQQGGGTVDAYTKAESDDKFATKESVELLAVDLGDAIVDIATLEDNKLDKTAVAAVEEVQTNDPQNVEKYVNPLRGLQQWLYLAINYSISELNTTKKKIVGAINDLYADLGGVISEISSLNTNKQNITDNSLNTTSKTIVGAINEVDAKVLGIASGLVFATESDMFAWVAIPANAATLKNGQNLYIIELTVPDYWWDFAAQLPRELEVKIDLTNYYNKGEVDALLQGVPLPSGGYANPLYLSNVDSDVAGYKTLSYTPDASETIRQTYLSASDGDKLVETFLYPNGVAVDFIPSGLWSFQFFADVNNTGNETEIGVMYFRRSTSGAETNIFPTIMWSSDINHLTADWVTIVDTQGVIAVNPTDRMGMRVYLRTTRTSQIYVRYTIGDGHGSFLNNPNRIRHNQLRDLNGDANFLHVTSTEKSTWDAKRDKIEIGDAHGFVAPPNASNYSVTNTGSNFTFNLLSNAGAYKINGTDYTNNGLSVNFTAQIGQNFITLSSAGLSVSTSAFDIESLTYIPVAVISWDGTRYRVGDELHTSGRSLKMHKMEHDTDGARFVSGFATTFGSSANNTFSSAQGVIRDEDRYHTIAAKTSGQILYRHSSLGYMVQDAPSTAFAKLNALVPQYDNNGTLTNLANSQYGIMWMYATNAKLPVNSEIVFVVGQGTYTSVANAQTAVQPTLVGMAVAEWKLLYRVIIRNVGGALLFIQADDLRLTTTGLAVQGGSTAIVSASNVTSTNGNVQSDLDKLNFNPFSWSPKEGWVKYTNFSGSYAEYLAGLQVQNSGGTSGQSVDYFFNQVTAVNNRSGLIAYYTISDTTDLLVYQTDFNVNGLSTAAEEYFVVDGFSDVLFNSATMDGTKGAWFKYNRAVNGDFLVCSSGNGSTVTDTVTSQAITVNTNYVIRIEINTVASVRTAKFYINGTLVATHTGLLTTGVYYGHKIVKTASSASTARATSKTHTMIYRKFATQLTNRGDFKPIGF